MNFSLDFNFSGFFDELRFMECASDNVGLHISPCSFQRSDDFLANCCRSIVPQPCYNPVCFYAVLAALFSPTPSHGRVFSAMVFICWYILILLYCQGKYWNQSQVNQYQSRGSDLNQALVSCSSLSVFETGGKSKILRLMLALSCSRSP